MTPNAYIERLGSLVAAGRDQEALAFARDSGPEVRPPLSAEQFAQVDGLIESAAMALSLVEAAAHRVAGAVRGG